MKSSLFYYGLLISCIFLVVQPLNLFGGDFDWDELYLISGEYKVNNSNCSDNDIKKIKDQDLAKSTTDSELISAIFYWENSIYDSFQLQFKINGPDKFQLISDKREYLIGSGCTSHLFNLKKPGKYTISVIVDGDERLVSWLIKK